MPRRITLFVYGILCYAVGLASLIYLILFIGGYGSPTKIDGSLEGNLVTAVVANVALCILFSLQHSAMARPMFKRWVTQFIPEATERSTYLLATGIALSLLFWLWRPMGGIVWSIESEPVRWLLHVVYFAGWGIVFLASFLINHFDLFGLRQVWLALRDKPYTDIPFTTPMLYSFVRHPIYSGVLIASWSAPTMGVARLVFALLITVYILVAIRWEERDLIDHLGEVYLDYRRRVPSLLPRPFGRRGVENMHT